MVTVLAPDRVIPFDVSSTVGIFNTAARPDGPPLYTAPRSARPPALRRGRLRRLAVDRADGQPVRTNRTHVGVI